jgi:uncharacterized protein YuzE
MKAKYDREEDILMIEIMPEGIIDHAEHVDGVIAHLTEDNRLVLLEILDASEFLSSLVKVTMRPTVEEELLPV